MAQQFQPQQFIAGHVRDIPRSGLREFFDIVQSMPDVVSLGVGEPDFVTPWHIREAAIYALERGKTGYTSNLGLVKLREAIGSHVEKKFGVAYDAKKQILVTGGVSEALDIALRAVVNPGDEVLYHEPCYVSYSPSITMAHGVARSEEHTSELQSRLHLVCRLLLEKKKKNTTNQKTYNKPIEASRSQHY